MSSRFVSVLLSCAFVAASIAPAQSQVQPPLQPEATTPFSAWQAARQPDVPLNNFLVVSSDKPDHPQACHVRSFTEEKLVCSRAFGGSRTYLPQQVLALIVPGDGNLSLKLLLAFNAGLGASIWGTVVLAATCPACAAATAFAALFCFAAAGATLIGDDQPDMLLYRAPGQDLSRKYRSLPLYRA